MTNSQTLIDEYVQRGSEEAFRELVVRYLDLVYSTAVRLVGGDAATAEDVAQTVFVDLARLAKSLSSEVKLGGWLHRHTCFVAGKTLRAERRRRSRERQAVEMNLSTDHSRTRLAEVAPILDEAINQLGAADRTAILLRFYERLDFRSVGAALGTNEAAAQKRVARALEKLHPLLQRRGLALSITALGAALADEAVKAAPAPLAGKISAMALTHAISGTGNTLAILKTMAATKLKTGIISAIIVASILTPLLLQRQAQARLREQDQTQRRQSDQLSQLMADNQRLAGLLAKAKNIQSLPDNQLLELLRLRSEVGRLQEVARKMTTAKAWVAPSSANQIESLKQMYAARLDQFKRWLEANPSENIPELQNIPDSEWLSAAASLATEDDFSRAASNLRSNAELQVLGALWTALRAYVSDNGGQFPTDLSALNPYLKTPIDNAILQRYAIVPASSLVSQLQPGGDWVITEIAPVNPALDTRFAYGLTNTSCLASVENGLFRNLG